MAGSKQFRPLKRIEPPEHVLIDLHALYPAPPHFKAEFVSGGVKVNTVVEGTLTMLGMTEEGFTIAYVSYELEFGRDKAPVSQWVPMAVVKHPW
ncbi:hypothetical protein HQO42_05370 [Rhodococcus fascians]|nr:hypothetical protein [Rhodococcus fascians]MBY4236565.1 hypothetical protein [Rhodococcus fascians]MBY4252069.1 hypothetical protein [Rhodococcus fascians]MBY4267910.1 hypothetical protein [Rhodococcus fascians]